MNLKAYPKTLLNPNPQMPGEAPEFGVISQSPGAESLEILGFVFFFGVSDFSG